MSNGNNLGANWLGLLRWSVAYSDGTNSSAFGEMTNDDKAWLEKVMKECVRDDPQRMNEVMLKLKESIDGNGSVDTIELDLEDLRDIVEQVDMAHVFTKFGGCDILVEFIEKSSVSDEIKSLAASVIATTAQNNILAQDLMFSAGIQQKLVHIFLQSSSPILLTKVSVNSPYCRALSHLSEQILYALSCSIRGHALSEESFVLKFSDLVFRHALSLNAGSIVSRVAFLANALITSDYCTASRIPVLCAALLPESFRYCNAIESVDVRENLFQLYGTFLQTAVGHRLLSTSCSAAFQDLLAACLLRLSSESPEEASHEKDLAQKCQVLAQSFHESFPSPQALANQARAESELGQSAGPMLMLAPPSLEASPQAP